MKKLVLKEDGERYWLEIDPDARVSGVSIMESSVINGEMIVHKYFYMRDFHPNWHLEVFHAALDPIETLEVEIEVVPNTQKIYLWSLDFFKKEARLDFETDDEIYAFFCEYQKYYDKRWEEIPLIELSLTDWEDLKKQWAQIKKDLPKYVIFELDDTILPNKITIHTKEVLTEEDEQCMKLEHEEYMRYELAKQEYRATLDDYSEEWRSPKDDEYHADIMKYYK